MKKNLLIIAMLIASFVATTIQAQNALPNGNFETWNSGTYDTPMYYQYSSNPGCQLTSIPFNVTKTTDAYHGAYAVKITTEADALGDTATGYFINYPPNKLSDPSKATGGMPYNQKPTGIRGYYKNSEMTGDTGLIFVIFSKAGVNTGFYAQKFGGVHTTYTPFNLTFNPPLSVTPDSVTIGFTSSNFNGIQLPGSTVTVDSISFTGVTSQPADLNGDFETWQSQTQDAPDKWFWDGDQQGDGMNKTSDAYKGNFAIELKTYAADHDNKGLQAERGAISTGWYPSCHSGNCHEYGGYPFSNQKDTLAFWYKYTPMGFDTADIWLTFKKNGSQTWSYQTNLIAAANYTYFEYPFNMGSAPDSVIIGFESSISNHQALKYVGSDLKIDEVHFKSQPLTTWIKKMSAEDKIVLYPNPINTSATLEIGTGIDLQGMKLKIYDVLGRNVSTLNINDRKTTFERAGMPSGIYFYELLNDHEIIKTGKMIIE